MSVFNKIINAVKFNDDDDYDDEDDLEEEEDFYGEDVSDRKESRRHQERISADESFRDEDGAMDEDREDVSERPRKRFPFSTNDHDDASSVSNQVKRQYTEAGMEVCIIKPTSVNDAREVTDTLMANSTVVLNLEGLDVGIAQRIIDFTSGSCYAVHGSVMKISHYIFVITPANVGVSGNISTNTADMEQRDGNMLNMPFGGRN